MVARRKRYSFERSNYSVEPALPFNMGPERICPRFDAMDLNALAIRQIETPYMKARSLPLMKTESLIQKGPLARASWQNRQRRWLLWQSH